MTKSKDIYSEYNVDVNKLTRDYQKFPLKKILMKRGGIRYEDLPQEDFVYLYIECNLPRKILAQYLNTGEDYIKRIGKLYNVRKSKEKISKNIKKSFIENYGVENVFQTEECKEKAKQTCLKKFGSEYYTQTDEYKEKAKQTCLKHFGVENPAQSPLNQEKMKQTNLERYGVEYYSQTDEFKNLFNDEEFVKQIKQKEYETKKKNGSFGKSEEEDKIYDILLTKFTDVKRQYHSDLYPFPCDFYIPCLDLYIEYQGYWSHGNEPYLGTDEQKEIIKEWENESQTKPQYSNVINTWTISDPLKRNTAKQNNLNWIEFFTMKEFIKWFESI